MYSILKEQSEQGLHCFPLHQYFSAQCVTEKSTLSDVKVNTTAGYGVPVSRLVTVSLGLVSNLSYFSV